MQVIKLLHKFLVESVPTMHAMRMRSLLSHVEGLLIGQQLNLTAIGRHLRGETREKDKIKRTDRLLGNVHLVGERYGI